jgi:hypothetical protein
MSLDPGTECCRAASPAIASDVMSRLRTASILAASLLALPAAAQGRHPGTIGLAGFADLGAGGAVAGNRPDGTSGGLFEAELGAGYDLGQGLRPELALLAGLAPSAYLGLRPGLRYSLDEMPFYFRLAVDFAAPGGSWRMRGLLGGGGAELRLTDLLSAFAEADVVVPVASKAGFPFLLRAGIGFRL